ncbi:MAG: hypothetical protein C4320_00575 [Armatimonadota bacterium]
MKTSTTLTIIATLALAAVSFARPQDSAVKPDGWRPGMKQTATQNQDAWRRKEARERMDRMTPSSSMSESMEDQDYSGWKDYFFGFRRGSTLSMFSAVMTPPKFVGVYDEQVFNYLRKEFFARESIPVRWYDTPMTIENDDTAWMVYEKLANTRRRELIKENEMRMMMMGNAMDRPMARPMAPNDR